MDRVEVERLIAGRLESVNTRIRQLQGLKPVTVLPTTDLYDGREVLLQAGNKLWKVRYNASSAFAEKWEYMEGAPLIATSAGQVFNPIGGAAQFGPVTGVLVPFAGVYEVSAHVSGGSPSGAGINVAAIGVSDGTTNVSVGGMASTNAQPAHGGGAGEFVTWPAGGNLRFVFSWPGFGGTWTLTAGSIMLRPIRLA